MQTFLVILIVLAALATVAALIRGIIIFLRTTEEELKNQGNGPSASGIGQNKAMRARIFFQALAVIFVILLLMLTQR
jgi:hypothetical protein